MCKDGLLCVLLHGVPDVNADGCVLLCVQVGCFVYYCMESRMITLTGVFLCVYRWAALCMESRMTTLTDHYTSLQFVPLCVQLGCFVYYCMESRMITLTDAVHVSLVCSFLCAGGLLCVLLHGVPDDHAERPSPCPFHLYLQTGQTSGVVEICPLHAITCRVGLSVCLSVFPSGCTFHMCLVSSFDHVLVGSLHAETV